MTGAYITLEEWKNEYRPELIERIALINTEILKLINAGFPRTDKRFLSLEYRRTNAERRLVSHDEYFRIMSLPDWAKPTHNRWKIEGVDR